jgi:putative endonuclease
MISSQKKFYYVYVLRSLKDKNLYVGYTEDLKSRFEQHSKGCVQSTKNRRPLEIIYSEACLNKHDVMHRENYLKTYLGKLFLKNRLKSYLTE